MVKMKMSHIILKVYINSKAQLQMNKLKLTYLRLLNN